MFARRSLALSLLLAAGAFAQTAPTDPLEARLAAIDAKAGAHHDLVARFTQIKKSPLLAQPIVTTGTVHARGDTTLWASEKPEPTRMRIDPQSLRIYYPKQKLVEQYPMQSKLGAMATSPLPRLATLRQQFGLKLDDGRPLVAEAPADSTQLRLEPTDEEIKPYVDHVRVLLDAGRGLVRAFEVVDPDGETTLLTFDDVRTDTNFPEAELALNAPADAKVSRPLEAK